MKSFKWIIKKSLTSKFSLLFLSIVGIGLALVNVAMTTILKVFTDIATNESKASIKSMVWVAMLLIALEGLLRFFQIVSFRHSKTKIAVSLRKEMLQTIMFGKLEEVKEMHSSDIQTRLTRDVDLVSNCIPMLIKSIINGFIMAIIAASYIFILNWKLAIVVLISIPILFYSIHMFSSRIQKAAISEKQAEDRNRSKMQDAINNIVLVQSYSAQSQILGKLDDTHKNHFSQIMHLARIEGIFSFLNNAMGTILFIIVMSIGAYLTQRNEFSVGGMIAVIQLLNYVTWPFANISDAISKVQQACVSADRIQQIIYITPMHEYKASKKRVSSIQIMQLCLQNVSFGYDEQNMIFNSINLHFDMGKVYGIYGINGSGKSTLLLLILGLIRAKTGMIFAVDESEQPNHIVKGDELLESISYVPSDHMICSGSVRDNITMMETSRIQDDKIWEVLSLCNLEQDIRTMDAQLNEWIGNGGRSLSSGQTQRLAIARALYRNTRILVFDEPTANLDQNSIETFVQVINTIRKNHIILIVTHDTSLYSLFNQVYLVQNGTVNEINNTHELMDILENNTKRNVMEV